MITANDPNTDDDWDHNNIISIIVSWVKEKNIIYYEKVVRLQIKRINKTVHSNKTSQLMRHFDNRLFGEIKEIFNLQFMEMENYDERDTNKSPLTLLMRKL